MLKKIFAFIIALSLIICTSCVFAANEMGDSMNKTGNTIKDATEGVKNVVGNVENGVEAGAAGVVNGIKDLGNTFSDGAARVTHDNNRNTQNNNNNYSAVRTATDGTFMGMNANTWTWFILAIAALAIIGLVWYYAMQNDTTKSKNDNR